MIKIKCGIHSCDMNWMGGGSGVNPIFTDEIPESYSVYTCPQCEVSRAPKPQKLKDAAKEYDDKLYDNGDPIRDFTNGAEWALRTIKRWMKEIK